MKLRKTYAVCMALILSLAALGGCSFSGKEYGTQKVPAGVNQTVVYDGMEASRESNRFKAEITLKDVVRGETVEDIFAAAGGYAGLDAELKSDSENFTISIKMKVDFRQAEPDTIVSIFDSDYSSLINGNGNISWKKAGESLENNGYIIRQTDKN